MSFNFSSVFGISIFLCFIVKKFLIDYIYIGLAKFLTKYNKVYFYLKKKIFFNKLINFRLL